MKLKWIGLICAAVSVMACTGCSSPYLPHNAFKYIPEFRAQGSIDAEGNHQEDILEENPMKRQESYFSPGSIRERYSQHIQNLSVD